MEDTYEDLSKFREAVLNIHNKYRGIHDSPPLQIDEQLNKIAQQFAEELLKIDPEDVQNEIIPPYGSNVYFGYVRYKDDYSDVDQLLENWYEQRKCYNYTGKMLPGNLAYVRNFTQLVWKESKSLGVGVAPHPSNQYKDVFVCIYDPPGNIDGEFERNVLPSKEEELSDIELSPEQQRELRELEESKEVLCPELKRLYAVPAEKVRVWAIWLSRVCEIADEWQKCLRSNTELMTSMAEQMRKTRQVVPGEKPKEKVHVLPMKEDRIKLWNDFPSQAALYRTYYKHWKEIGYRASAHIANRPVTDTTEYRATKDDGGRTAADAPDAPSQYSMRQTESDVAQLAEETTEAPAAATSAGIDPTTTDAPERDAADAPPIALSDDQSEAAELPVAEKTSEMEAKSVDEEKEEEEEEKEEEEEEEEKSREKEPTPTSETDEETPTSETAAAIEATKAIEVPVSMPLPEIVAISDPEVGIKKRKAAARLIKNTGDFTAEDCQSYPGFFYLRATKADKRVVEQHTDDIKKGGLERIYDLSRGTWLYYSLLDKVP